MTQQPVYLTFDDNTHLVQLFGGQNEHLERLEKALNVAIFSRGEMVAIEGSQHAAGLAAKVLQSLYTRVKHGDDISTGDVDAAVRMLSTSPSTTSENSPAIKEKTMESNHHESSNPERITISEGGIVITTPKKRLTPYSHRQATYMHALMSNELVFAAGPAGTGKTYIAVAAAVAMFAQRKVERIILSRPAVEAGEKLGFLPGDLKEKVDPYLRPMYDALYDMLPAEKVVKHLASGEIEIAPLAYMRGRTLRNAYVILDEAQNTSAVQMKMFLTRLGEGSRMVVTGDLTQTDLPKGEKSGFRDALEKLSDIEEVATINFTAAEVVRHPLTTKIVQAYEQHDKEKLEKWEKK